MSYSTKHEQHKYENAKFMASYTILATLYKVIET